MTAVVSVASLSKTYASGFQALRKVNLEIHRGEIFALLGPNGAGKTTLISIICGIVNPTEGVVRVSGHDIVREYRVARSLIGLVPQELTTDAFESVWGTVSFSRGLFGRAPDPSYVEKVLSTHYLEEAEEMADRVGVINKGEIILVEDKIELMRKLGKKQLTLQLHHALKDVPHEPDGYGLELGNAGTELIYTYDSESKRADIVKLLKDVMAIHASR